MMAGKSETPSVGSDVHYTDHTGRCRAAKIVEMVPVDDDPTVTILTVFHPSLPPYVHAPRYHAAAENGYMPNTWHWPERVG